MADSLFILFLISYKSLRQLIGAGGGLEAATDALKTGYRFVYAHSNQKLCNALCVSGASAGKLYVGDDAVLYVNIYFS